MLRERFCRAHSLNISVITPCYNAADTLEACLGSVAEQSRPALEHIVIDGQSTDGSLALLEAASAKSANLKFRQGPDLGIYDAMNKGIELASGDIIAILNADDCFASPDILEAVSSAFESLAADVIFSHIDYFDANGHVTRQWRVTPFEKGAFRRGWHPPHPGFFAKRQLYLDLGGFDLSFPVAADFELMLRFMERPDTTATLMDRVTVNMRDDGVSGSLLGRLKGGWDLSRALHRHGLSLSIPGLLAARYIKKSKAVLFKRGDEVE